MSKNHLEYEEVTIGSKKIRIEKSTRKLLQKVIDHYTLKHLEKISKKLELDEIYGSIGEGKESVVFLAKSQEDFYAIKIYRIETFPIKKLKNYIDVDERFITPKNRTKFIFIWTKKEFSNLKRAYRVGVLTPIPVMHYKNILVTNLLGNEGIPAPKLLEIELENPHKILEKIIENYIILISEAKLVHADLSEYNILIHENLPYFIDFSQSVVLDHPMAREWFERDIENIYNFFTKKYNLKLSYEEIINKILENSGWIT